MEQEKKQEYLKFVKNSREAINMTTTLNASQKNRVTVYCDMIEKKIAMIEDFDGRREKWVADLEEYTDNINKVLKRIPIPKISVEEVEKEQVLPEEKPVEEEPPEEEIPEEEEVLPEKEESEAPSTPEPEAE